MLVKIVRQDDAAVEKTRFVEHAARHLREPREVARVDPDARKPLTAFAHLKPDRDGVAHALHNIVGIDQQNAVFGEKPARIHETP